jgi:hypothetical protein
MSDVGARSFARLIEGVGGGDLLADLSNNQHELMSSMQTMANYTEMKIKGELTLKLKQTTDHRGNVSFDWDVSIKKPKRKRITAQAWTDKSGNVVFQSPKQPDLPGLREVKITNDEAREVTEQMQSGREV